MNYFHKTLWFLGICITGCSQHHSLDQLITPFERSGGQETTTYEEGLQWWKMLEEASPYVCVQTFGATDAGRPLHLVVINAGRNFSQEKIAKSGKTVLLINNGIHPGEPDGIDASMLFARDMLSDPEFEARYENVVFLVIPFYNIGGTLNRNCCSRASQNGPISYGFRGNARNLDLNRDFIKGDSKNSQSFQQLFTLWKPDVYLETHVSNGADYPYTMTYLFTHPDKLTAPLADFVKKEMIPPLEAAMKEQEDEMIPYVNVFSAPPDSGYTAFYDTPRYSSGYAALHQSIAVLTETHMLKPFDQRVASTRRFLHALATMVNEKHNTIKTIRVKAFETLAQQKEFVIDWQTDSSNVTPLPFNGYTAYYDTSDVTGMPQLYYDPSRPWTKNIPYYEHLRPSMTVSAPRYYLVPGAWSEVVDRLTWNGVQMTPLTEDTVMDISIYEILSYQTVHEPYEGHYLHYQTDVAKRPVSKQLISGTYYLVDVEQPAKRFIIETLEPGSPDSYFNWNFYDEVLQQKEWFSSYIFDKEANTMLSDPAISKRFNDLKQQDTAFCSDAFGQLYYLYRESSHYERDCHKVYPVFRIE